MKNCLPPVLSLLLVFASGRMADAQSSYRSELNIPYCTADGKTLTLNAFLPPQEAAPSAAMVEFHGGAFVGGMPMERVETHPAWPLLASRNIAVFSVGYRLGPEGGFPQNIRDCRNAVRFLRKNAERFHIDPDRIACMGESAGGYLSLMVAMVPENFEDGGAAEGLQGTSARVASCFSTIAPTDLCRLWQQQPGDAVVGGDGKQSTPESKTQTGLRALFHGIAPDTAENRDLYQRMSPIGHVRKDLPPLLICDGQNDPIVPGLHGRGLHDKLLAAGAPSTYWLTWKGGHSFPGGSGFPEVLERFIDRTLKGSLDPLAPYSHKRADGQIVKVVKCYPEGLMRAHCMSFDDGRFDAEKPVIEGLRKRGLPGTFFLNSLHPQSQAALEHPDAYVGFEVASHGAHHKGLGGRMTPEEQREEIAQDQKILGERFLSPIHGFAYAYGDTPKDADGLKRLEGIMQTQGIVYARWCGETRAFRPPDNFLRWVPDCGLGSQQNIDLLLNLPAEDSVRVLMSFTHPVDIGKGNFTWEKWEEYLDRLSKEPKIWKQSLIGFAEYVNALRGIIFSADGIGNPAKIPVWVKVNDKPTEILPGKTLRW